MQSPPTASGPKQKRPIACSYCRLKKVRCIGAINDRSQPCTNCFNHGIECVSPVNVNRARQKVKNITQTLEARINRVEALLKANADSATAAEFPDDVDQGNDSQLDMPMHVDYPYHEPQRPQRAGYADIEQADERMIQDESCRPSYVSPRGATLSALPEEHGEDSVVDLAPTGILPTNSPELEPRRSVSLLAYNGAPSNISSQTPINEQEGGSVFSSESSNWEYHGPRSYLSICSKAGTQWVANVTGSNAFYKTANQLTMDVTQALKIPRRFPRGSTPEPDQETAWRYAKAYFKYALDAPFGIVSASWFEAQLRAQWDGKISNENYSWYALRNTVYAFGCRLELAKSASFREAYTKSWQYFENAMTVHTDLIYYKTDLMAVQALIAMAYFVEGLGTPNLEYMLCSDAARLAQAKGLHRQPATSWGLSEMEITHRAWMFWAIYVYEKHVALRAGRPSVCSIIHDDDVSCQIPTTSLPGAHTDIRYCTLVIKLAQIGSQAARKLSSVTTFSQTPEDIIKTVNDLDANLRAIKDSVDPIMALDRPLDAELPWAINREQAIYAQLAFNGLLLDIHSVLTFPWFSEKLCSREHPEFRNQMVISSEIVAEASRSIILSTVHLPIDCSSPVLLVFFYPIYGLINLFVHTLKYPSHASVQSDIALLDVCAGHFARVEYASNSELSLQFARDIADLARVAVKRAKEMHTTDHGKDQLAMSWNDANSQIGPDRELRPDPSMAYNDPSLLDLLDYNFDSWSMLLPPMDHMSSENIFVPSGDLPTPPSVSIRYS